MLETLLKWIAAGDEAVLAMGPIVATALAMLGGSAFTQLVKFPLAGLLPDRWVDWSIRTLAIASTWVALHWLTHLPVMLELVLALAQPYAYTLAMRLIRHRWPWLEATKLAGSAQPSDQARAALLDRRDTYG